MLLLPLQRGPLHGFYHFLLGYWVPVMSRALLKRGYRFAVVDSEPLNHWFELVPGGTPEIVDRAKSIRLAFQSRLFGLAGGYRIAGFVGWDKWQDFHRRDFPTILGPIRNYLSLLAKDIETRRPEILVIGRDFTPDFYAKKLPTRYGGAKRNIPNLQEVVKHLSKKFSVEFVDGALVPPLEMFAKCQSAKLLIGQHGAGLANLIFLREGACVMEIGWPTIRQDNQSEIFRLLSMELGIKWCRTTLQEYRFGEIRAEALEREILLSASELGIRKLHTTD